MKLCPRWSPLTGAALLALGMSGCTNDVSEIQAWMDETRANTPRRTGRIPEPKRFVPFRYEARTDIDPFSNAKLQVALARFSDRNKGGITPDLNRRREPLEAFPLDTIRLVGHLHRSSTGSGRPAGGRQGHLPGQGGQLSRPALRPDHPGFPRLKSVSRSSSRTPPATGWSEIPRLRCKRPRNEQPSRDETPDAPDQEQYCRSLHFPSVPPARCWRGRRATRSNRSPAPSRARPRCFASR